MGIRAAARVDRERETEMSFRLMARAAALVATAAFALVGSTAAQAATPSGSDLGPVGWSSGSGDPNLGVLNDGTRTLNFDGGWRFKLVNTADTSDPTGLYGNSSDPKADAPGFDDAGWQRAHAPARLEHHPGARSQPEQRDRLLPRRPGLVSQDVHAARVDGGQADLAGLRRRVRELVRLPQRPARRQPSLRLHRLQLRHHASWSTPTATRPTCWPSSCRTRSRAAGGTPAAASPGTCT